MKPKLQNPPRGRPASYPWERWADGRIHTLRRGKHFKGDAGVLQWAARYQAKRRGLKVVFVIAPDKKSARLQFSKPAK